MISYYLSHFLILYFLGDYIISLGVTLVCNKCFNCVYLQKHYSTSCIMQIPFNRIIPVLPSILIILQSYAVITQYIALVMIFKSYFLAKNKKIKDSLLPSYIPFLTLLFHRSKFLIYIIFPLPKEFLLIFLSEQIC